MFKILGRRLKPWLFQKDRIYLLLGILCMLGSVTLTANAILTVSGTGLFGSSDVLVDGNGTLNLGTSSSTAVVIGKAGVPVTMPGNLTVAGTFTLGSASSTGQLIFKNASTSFTTILQASSSQASNLTFTLPNATGTPGQAMLTDGSGNLYFGGIGSSQWLNNASGTISYLGESIGINTTTPTALLSIVGSSTSPSSLLNIVSSSGASLFNVSSNGNVTIAGKYYGDGSALTGISGGAPGWSRSGTTLSPTNVGDSVSVGSTVLDGSSIGDGNLATPATPTAGSLVYSKAGRLCVVDSLGGTETCPSMAAPPPLAAYEMVQGTKATTLYDATGRYDGTLSATAPSWTSPASLTFNGTNNYATSSIPATARSFSILVTFQDNGSSGYATLVSQDSGSDSHGWGFTYKGGTHHLCLTRPNHACFIESTTNVGEGQWATAVLTVGAATASAPLHLYVNGVLTDSALLTDSLLVSSNPFTIGADNAGAAGRFSGQIAVVRYYDRELQAGEVLAATRDVHDALAFPGNSCTSRADPLFDVHLVHGEPIQSRHYGKSGFRVLVSYFCYILRI